MRYWDSSALVALVVQEKQTPQCETWLREDPQIATWWLSRVECASAINRLHRENALDSAGLRVALRDLGELSDSFVEVLPNDTVRSAALRLLRVHPLRAADALQLAAAIIAAGDERALEFASFDARLVDAADKEGLPCLAWPEG